MSIFPLERNRYFYGKLLTVRDFETEQRYFNNKRRLLNRTAIGAGVLCGMSVAQSDDTTLMIESGLALDYAGREICIREPLIRRIQMLDGYGSLIGKASAYLCLEYDERETDSVNAVGAEASQTHQFNKVEETARLYLSAEEPPYRELLAASGADNINIVYATEALTIVLYIPQAVCGGDEFNVKALIIRSADTPAVHIKLSGDGGFIENADGSTGAVMLEYEQSAEDTRTVSTASFKVRAQSVSGVMGQLFPDGAELHIELGERVYKNYITLESSVRICRDKNELTEYTRGRDSLKNYVGTPSLPIYLAKLELVSSTGGVFVRGVCPLPFSQLCRRDNSSEGQRDSAALRLTATARSLEYWQKPDVKASYSAVSDSIQLDFGIPTPEVYDYCSSHGSVDIQLVGGSRVNARYYSEEIPHGLGIGNVNVTLALEYGSGSDTAQLIGQSEVFRSRTQRVAPPQIECAAIVYPERGTMVIGIWLHDSVDGSSVRVHYYASKPDRDTKKLIEKTAVSVKLTPEIVRVPKLGQVRLKASVTGAEDKKLTWELGDKSSGDIDQNGIYKAPEAAGTYEITARSAADPTASASAFVIVE